MTALVVRLVVGLVLDLVLGTLAFAFVADFPVKRGLAIRTADRKALRQHSTVRAGLCLPLELISCPRFGHVVDVCYDCADESATYCRSNVYGESLCRDESDGRYELDYFDLYGTVTGI